MATGTDTGLAQQTMHFSASLVQDLHVLLYVGFRVCIRLAADRQVLQS